MDWSEEYDAQVLEDRAPWGWTQHLRVRRRDGRDGISWDMLQAIKDEVLGPDVVAVEIYPPHDLIVNETNMRHLWSVPDGLLGIGLLDV